MTSLDKSGKFSPFLCSLFAALVCSCVVVIPFLPSLGAAARSYVFEVDVASNDPGQAQFFYDIGRGFSESDSVHAPVPGGSAFTTLHFLLPTGDYRQLRFDPIDHPGQVQLKSARIVTLTGTAIHTFKPSDFTAQNQIESLRVSGDALTVATAANGTDPNLGLQLERPIELAEHRAVVSDLLQRAIPVFVVFAAGLIALRFCPPAWRLRARERRERIQAFLLAHPGRAVALTAVLAVAVSSYPVLFLGKSYVSPNFSDGTNLLYGKFPTLPGYTDATMEDAKGSDVGAIIWQQVPYAFIQSRALLHDHELPLWNRYNSGGTVLLGQGQSMFGDPLHLPVILAGGAAWAWDFKYLLARWLLGLGLGLLVLHCTRHVPSAMVAALASAFLGFFIYRLNHPAYFSFCYAPWLLYAWVRIADAVTWKQLAGWCGLLVLASVSELNSGTVKEAYMLLFGMYFAGFVVVVSTARPWPQRLIAVGAAIWSAVLFVLLTAPTWLTLMDSLKQAYTSYAMPTAYQIHPSIAVGFFDEIFYRPLIAQERVFNPSANFLVLMGVLYFVATFSRAKQARHARALAWGSLLPLALVFGILPPQWIASVPFLGNVVHIDNSFSCVLIVLSVVIAGFGWRMAFTRLGTVDGPGDLGRVAGLYALLVVPWISLTQTVHRPTFGEGTTFTFLHWGQRLPVSGFVWGSLIALTAAGALLLWSVRRALVHRSLDATGVLLIGLALTTLLWRHGQHTTNVGAADYVFTPGVRADFHAASAAIEGVKSDEHEPERDVGLGDNLFPGWSSAYAIEGVGGADALLAPYYRELISGLGVERIWDWRVYVTAAQLPTLKKALDFLNVRHYLDQPGGSNLPTTLVHRVHHADLDVYRSESTWPRAFYSSTLTTYETPQQLGDRVRESNGRPFASVQVTDLEKTPALRAMVTPSSTLPAVAKARRYQITSNSTSFTVDTTGPGIVVLQETWLDRCFRATLNGKPVPYFRVNHAFKGLQIPRAGTYEVAFTYWPRRFDTALALAAVGLVLALVTFGLIRVLPLRPLSEWSTRGAGGETPLLE
ncbi:MAG: hypothetical protein ABIZ04_05755 [Opitutus sp.]